MRLIFDIETNGLYRDSDTIHCIIVRDSDTGKVFTFNDQGSASPISSGITLLEEADILIGHNIIGFDIPFIQKIYPWFNPPTSKLRDTLVLSHLRYPDMMKVDVIKKFKGMPKNLYGRHSLEAYGYRLGENKDEFGKTADWSSWSQEMQNYCVQDTKVTHKLWRHFQSIYPQLLQP